jgi:menaquinol-cytochrome c reductase iron-sulfur subunit
MENIVTDDSKNKKQCAPEDRRTFFLRLTLGLSGLIGAILALPAVGFVMGPILRKPARVWRSVGRVEDFDEGTTVLVEFEDPSPQAWAGLTATTAAWLRCDGPAEFVAFSINCRHLGCPVRWIEGPELFMCPCHGGVYYKDGEVAAGPPPRALQKYPLRIKGGLVEIQTSPVPLPGERPQGA